MGNRKPRKTISENEISIRADALRSSIKRDFLNNDVSYQDASEMRFLVGRVNTSPDLPKLIRVELKASLDANFASANDGKVAVFKRNPAKKTT